LLGVFADVAKTVATPLIRRKREQFSESAAPAAGDILLYQARGGLIRNYIRRRVKQVVKENGGDVILLAHSLGGIACVDLLATTQLPVVKKLITVGSQASFLYEINALWSLRYGESLPSNFPEWLNLYDPYDFLSYLVAPVFKRETVRDCRIESGQPFPESHSAYWNNPDTWKAIEEFCTPSEGLK
jgi:pimeloyl-ACP methyl ester carboxylesterase